MSGVSSVLGRKVPWRDRQGRLSALKAAVFALLFAPAAVMIGTWLGGGYGLTPIVPLIYWSGAAAAWLLLATLFVTPARRIFRQNRLIAVRRMLGVASLAYTLGHLAIYVVLRGFDAGAIFAEITSRLGIAAALLALAGLLALGATSLDATIARLGPVAWNRLHSMVYIVAALAILHFVMAPGSGGGLPFLMVGVYAWLMAWRVLERFRLGTRAPVLFGLALVAALFTAGFEAVWLALSHGYPALETLRFNFSLELGPSAAWRVLALGLLVAGAAAALGHGGRPSPARR